MDDDLQYIEENSYNDGYVMGESLENNTGLPTKCELCNQDFKSPVVLNCLHVFDRECLGKFESHSDDQLFSTIKCPKCATTSASLSTLEPFHLNVVLDGASEHSSNSANCKDNVGPDGDCQPPVLCTLCTADAVAEYKCNDCASPLCEGCRNVHKVMKMFSSHSVTDLSEEEKKNIHLLNKKMNQMKPVMCSYHKSEAYKYFCFQCHIPICMECAAADHKSHINCNLDDVPEKLSEVIQSLVKACQSNETRLKETGEILQTMLMDITTSRDQNRSHIEEVCNDWKAAIDEVKDEFLKRNKEYHDEMEMKVLDGIDRTEKTIDHIDYSIEFTRSYVDKCSPAVMAKIVKTVVSCLEQMSHTEINTKMLTTITFNDDRSRIKDIVRRDFGWFDDHSAQSHLHGGPSPGDSVHLGSMGMHSDCMNAHASSVAASTALSTLTDSPGHMVGSGSMMNVMHMHDQAIGGHSNYLSNLPGSQHHGIRSIQDSPTESHSSSSMGGLTGLSGPLGSNGMEHAGMRGLTGGTTATGSMDFGNVTSASGGMMGGHHLINSTSMIGTGVSGIGKSFSGLSLDTMAAGIGMNGNGGRSGTPHGMDSLGMGLSSSNSGDQLLKPGSISGYNPSPNPPFPNRSNRCSMMTVLYRWGSLGAGREQLSSPHGFCLGFDEEIVVADTQNHRIQIFSKTGEIRDQFGVPGREEGQLWYPRKVATLRSSQKYVVCDRGNERSRMQIFTRSGHFIKKIVIRYIDIVAGLAVNAYGHIVAVDSVSPTVFVISENGDLIKWFDCSDYMKEPSDIAISGRELYICDFKGHCVAVFQEDGVFLRRIGSEAVTNFPNGIDVSDHGDVLIGDSHGNRFHISIYSRAGNLMSEFECPSVKVSRCCGLKITSEGYVVTLAKNNHHVLVLDTLYVA